MIITSENTGDITVVGCIYRTQLQYCNINSTPMLSVNPIIRRFAVPHDDGVSSIETLDAGLLLWCRMMTTEA